jgi:hypothetical protein
MTTPKPKPAPAPPREERPIVHVPDPSSLTFGDMFRIKAATGVDVLDPPTRAHAIAACLWLATRDHPEPRTWEECTRYDLDHVDLIQPDEELPDGDEDPTGGSETPSSASSSL